MSDELPAEVRLANDIARAFSHLPTGQGAEEVASHIRQFWDPRMREALTERIGAADPRLDPLVTRAVHPGNTPA